MIVFDIGAGDGNRAAGWIRTFKDCIVYAFEPDPRQFARLQETRSKLKLDEQRRLKIFNSAVWNKTGKMDFYVCNDITSSSLFPFVPENIKAWKYPPGRHFFKTIDIIEVECVTIDSVVKQEHIEIIDFIRIDAQGAAKQVLQGINGKMFHRIKEIFVKCNVAELEIYRGQTYKEDVDRILLKQYFIITDHQSYSRNQEMWVRYVSDIWKKSMSGKIYGLS